MIPALAICAFAWAVLSCLTACLPGCAHAIGRFRAHRARSYTNLSTHRPPLWQAITRDSPAFRGETNDQPEPPTTVTVRPLRYLPPVPPSRPDPMADQPADVLEGEALRARFADVVSWGWVS